MFKSRVFSLFIALMMLFSVLGTQMVFAETSSEPYYLEVLQTTRMADAMEDWDLTFTVTGPNGSDTVSLSPEQKTDTGNWVLSFNIGQFSEEDDITITYTGDESISCQDGNHDELSSFKVGLEDYGTLNEDDTEWVSDMRLVGTQTAPKIVWIVKDFKNEAKVTFIHKDGLSVANMGITATTPSGLSRKEYTTDDSGAIYINVDDFDTVVDLYFTDKQYVFYKSIDEESGEVTSTYGKSISPLVAGRYFNVMVCDNENLAESADKVDYDITLTGARQLLFNCDTLSLNFSNEGNSFTVDNLNLGTNTKSIPVGIYTVSSVSNAKGYNIATQENINTNVPLTVAVDTTHTLKVTDSTSPTNSFTVVNIDALEGKSFAVNQEYAVLPESTLMLKNVSTDKVYTVTIDKEYCEIDMGTGAVVKSEDSISGSKYAPPTGDWVDWVILVLIIGLIALAVVLFLLYKNNKNIKPPKGTQTLALLLAVALLSSALPTTTYAAGGHSLSYAGGDGSGSYSPVKGNFSYIDKSIVKLSFIENSISETDYRDSSVTGLGENVKVYVRGDVRAEDEPLLATQSKFDSGDTSVFIATSSDMYTKALNGGTFTFNYADNPEHIALAQYGRSFSSGYCIGDTDDERKTSWNNWYVRLLPMYDNSKDILTGDGRLGTGNADIDYFLNWCYNGFAVASVSADAGFGNNLQKYVDKTIDTTDPKMEYSADELNRRQTEEAQLVKGWIDYLAYYGQISYERQQSLYKEYEDGLLTILVETCPGFKFSGGDEGVAFFVTTHDLMAIFHWTDGTNWGDPRYEVKAVSGAYTVAKDYGNVTHKFCTSGQTTKNGYNCLRYPVGNKCKTFNHIAFGGILAVTNNDLKALNPSGTNIDTSVAGQKFGGWSYIDIAGNTPIGGSSEPGIWATYSMRLLDKSGNVVEVRDSVEVPQWGKSDLGEHSLLKLDDWYYDGIAIPIPKTIEYGGNTYVLTEAPEGTFISVALRTTSSGDDNTNVKTTIDYAGLTEQEYEDFVVLANRLAEKYEIGEGVDIGDTTVTGEAQISVSSDSESFKRYMTDLKSNKDTTIFNGKSGVHFNFDENGYATSKDDISLVDVYTTDASTVNADGKCKRYKDIAFCEVDETGDASFTYDFAMQYLSFKNLGALLDSSNDQGMYYDKDEHGNVLIEFQADYYFDYKIISDSTQGTESIPEWRINKYWSNVVPIMDDKEYQYSQGSLSYTEDTGHKKSKAKFVDKTENGTDVNLIPCINDLGDLPFATVSSMTLKTVPKSPTTTLSSKMWGDLMAFKTADVDDLATAEWVNGNAVSTTYTVDVSVNNGNTATTSTRTFEVLNSKGEDRNIGSNYVNYTDSNGNRLGLHYSFVPEVTIQHLHAYRSHCSRHCHCKANTWEAVGFGVAKTADYYLDMTFNCHNKAPLENYKSFINTESKDLDTGYAEFTQQSNDTIRLYSEYPMLFTDVTHQNSIRFMSADKATEFAPISYHTLKYDANITPNISGVAATDSRATAQLAEMGIADAQMLPKGSVTTSSYEVEGTLTAKTYALDFQTAKQNNDAKINYKTRWGSKYSADNVNADFLAKFSEWDVETNTYKATLNANENLKIDSQLYGDIPSDISITADKCNVDEYVLTVRAGEITAINGDTDWEANYSEIATILIEELKANHEGVFSVFNVGDGDELTEAKFAELASDVREGSDSIAVGSGWYSEDTTVLSLYVYTTVFSLKGTTFANKIPTSIAGLEAPQDKSQFFSNAFDGDLQLDLTLQITPASDGVYDERCAVAMQYATDSSNWADSEYNLYAVPNVSVLDNTF